MTRYVVFFMFHNQWAALTETFPDPHTADQAATVYRALYNRVEVRTVELPE